MLRSEKPRTRGVEDARKDDHAEVTQTQNDVDEVEVRLLG